MRLRNTLRRSTFAVDPADLARRSPPLGWRRFLGFNGDFVRACIILRLLRNLPVDAFVETGTGRGETALLVSAQTDLPVTTCDISEGALRRARRTLRFARTRVRQFLGDSPESLRRLAAEPAAPRCPFFYLDAHTLDDIPLVGELRAIFESWRDYAILLDDFRVPDAPGFRCYAWGSDVLDLDYIRDTLRSVPREPGAFFPAYSPRLERGLRAGWMLLTSPDLTDPVRRLLPETVLRPFPLRV